MIAHGPKDKTLAPFYASQGPHHPAQFSSSLPCSSKPDCTVFWSHPILPPSQVLLYHLILFSLTSLLDILLSLQSPAQMFPPSKASLDLPIPKEFSPLKTPIIHYAMNIAFNRYIIVIKRLCSFTRL